VFLHKLFHHVFESFVLTNWLIKEFTLCYLSPNLCLYCLSKSPIIRFKTLLYFLTVMPDARPPDPTASFIHLLLLSRSWLRLYDRKRSEEHTSELQPQSNHLCPSFLSINIL